ncbi:MAG: hypothetical protein IEMM0002_1356 [bacterium]|nr:MAG: hypothetical protein IEMM0002_1356 [bacterium]
MEFLCGIISCTQTFIMTKQTDEFEQMIMRVHELLEDQDVDVKWNEKIPDPDNPTQTRQIDVLIRKDNLLDLVECRIHKEKQDVKWIEELIGRRISLNADAVIAVSARGFTSGAIKKAASYGIILNDLLSLSKEEIKSWSKAIEVSLFFYRFDNFEISLFFDPKDIADIDQEIVAEELKNYYGLRSIFNAPLEIIGSAKLIVKENRNNTVNFNVTLKIDGFLLQGKEVKEIKVKGKAALEQIVLNVPMTLAYGKPKSNSENRNVYIQKYDLGQTDIVHHNGNISICLDLSKLEVPPFWQFRFMEIAGKYENYFEKLEIIEPEKMNMKVDKCIVNFGVINV